MKRVTRRMTFWERILVCAVGLAMGATFFFMGAMKSKYGGSGFEIFLAYAFGVGCAVSLITHGIKGLHK